MKTFIATAFAALAIATPAQAQVTIYNNTPMTWQTPTGCLSSVRFEPETAWTKSACMRVEVSTAGESHNIRFVTENTSITYITSKASPRHVHAVGFIGPGGSMATAANGDCEITSKGFLSCKALVDGVLSTTHVASFVGAFPEASAILY
ncbi:MAG: hypothetical protein RL509_1357 [Pseudomonadota bacterium]|jgi:hypothetical protein